MSQVNAYEQYMLELINAERAKVGVQPLAFDSDLNESAANHSAWMISTDTFSHTGAGGSSAGDRMKSAGYVFNGSSAWAENIAWMSTRAPAGLQNEVEQLHTSLMNSSGHRANLLNATYREIGVGLEVGQYGSYEGAFVTQNFARTASNSFLIGVTFDDLDGDKRYDIGEGLGSLTINARNNATGAIMTTKTNPAGGYELELATGNYTVNFSGSGFATTTLQASIGTRNVKLDLIDPAANSGVPTTPPPSTISGTLKSDTLSGTFGNDVILGLGGNDTLNGGAGNDRLNGGIGADAMNGGLGNDIYVVDNVGDVVNDPNILQPFPVPPISGGIDTVESGISYVLGATIENLTLTGGAVINGTGNALNNIINGNDANNVLSGLNGNDTLNGGNGNDTLIGGNGNDNLNGGNGNDILNGGAGIDILNDGAGNDILDYNFVYDSLPGAGARDLIFGFNGNGIGLGDQIDLSTIDANVIAAGNQAFTYIGAATFTAAGQIRYDGGILRASTDSDVFLELEIQLVGAPPLFVNPAFPGTDIVL